MKSECINYDVAIMNESNLPQYPIPKMKDVLNRYLEWVEPLVNRIDYFQAKVAVEKFLNSELAPRLECIIDELGHRKNNSWIFDYWVEAHLKVRNPLTPHTNVPVIYENDALDTYDPLQKMAIIIHAVTSIYKDFKENGTRAYTLYNKTYSSDQFHGVLASINHIKEDLDTYYINNTCSENMVFLYKNHIHNIPVIIDNQVISVGRIYLALKSITSLQMTPQIPNVNYVTIGVNRDKAGQVLKKYLKTMKIKIHMSK